jgi:N-acyl-D-amino-acid deacylase
MAAIVARRSRPARSASRPVRTIAHRAIDGEPVPGTFAAEDELFGIGAALGELGHRRVRAGPRRRARRGPRRPRAGDGLDARLAGRHRPAGHLRAEPEQRRPRRVARLLDLSAEAAPRGARVRPQVHGRTVSLLLGFQTFHPFSFTPPGRRRPRPPAVAEQVARIRRPRPPGPPRRRRWSPHGRRPDRHGLHAPEPHLRARRPARLRARAPTQRGRHRRGPGVDEWELLSTCSSATTVGSCSTPRCSTTPTATSTPWARCCSTRPRRSASATAAPTPARPATPRPPRSCSPTGPATAPRPAPVEEAVHKMTQATATLYGLGDRGVLGAGLRRRRQRHRPRHACGCAGPSW